MWVKVDDSMPDHPKFEKAGQSVGRDGMAKAICLYLAGLCYAARNLTDGFLPAYAVDGMRQSSNPLGVAAALVKVGLWEPAAGGFQIHDYHHYQPPAAKVKDKREKDRARKAHSVGIPRGKVVESERIPEGIRGTGSDLNILENQERSDRARANFAPTIVVGPLEPSELIRWFNKIYAAYPNKDRKVDANRAWVELAPSPEVAQAIWTDVDRRVQAGWKRFERRFIPLLRTYLTERMWEDATEESAGPIYEDDSVPLAWTCPKCGEIHEGTREQRRTGVCLKPSVAGR